MTWLVMERTSVKLYKPYYQTIKRIMEVLVCLLAGPLIVLVGVIIAILIRLDSPGPVFFRAGTDWQRWPEVQDDQVSNYA